MSENTKKRVLPPSQRDHSLSRLESEIGYCFKDRRLLYQALTHSSYACQSRRPGVLDNERMEFYGDAVLGFLVSKMLLRRFPQSDEGSLSCARASIVDTETLASLAERVHLGRFLFLGSGEEKSGGRMKKSVLANSFEALTAAVCLDGGIASAERFVDRFFSPLLPADALQDEGKDFKTKLQELSHAVGCNPPVYIVDDVSGPDHDLMFRVTVIVGDDCFGKGTGKTRKEAEQAAAREGLMLLQEDLRRLS
ncbi:MAG: ribonuclease III [Geobacteraceae bacterium]|nr:ribonuclease III [Geobacteraceae bacterium]